MQVGGLVRPLRLARDEHIGPLRGIARQHNVRNPGLLALGRGEKGPRRAGRRLLQAPLRDGEAGRQRVARVPLDLGHVGGHLVGVDAAGTVALVVGHEQVFHAVAVDVDVLGVKCRAHGGVNGDGLHVGRVGEARLGVEDVELLGEVGRRDDLGEAVAVEVRDGEEGVAAGADLGLDPLARRRRRVLGLEDDQHGLGRADEGLVRAARHHVEHAVAVHVGKEHAVVPPPGLLNELDPAGRPAAGAVGRVVDAAVGLGRDEEAAADQHALGAKHLGGGDGDVVGPCDAAPDLGGRQLAQPDAADGRNVVDAVDRVADERKRGHEQGVLPALRDDLGEASVAQAQGPEGLNGYGGIGSGSVGALTSVESDAACLSRGGQDCCQDRVYEASHVRSEFMR